MTNFDKETLKTLREKKQIYADISFMFFQHGVETTEDCLNIEIIKFYFIFYPNTINLIISYYFTENIETYNFAAINKEVGILLETESKKKST